jgi:hypothetical protein
MARWAAVLSWLGWCAEHGYDGPSVPLWVKRMTPPDSETPARSKMAIDRLVARRDGHGPEPETHRADGTNFDARGELGLSITAEAD